MTICIGYTLQKLKEMHEANDRVLEQLRRQQGSYVVDDSEEKPSVVDIEGLKMCDNCGKANSLYLTQSHFCGVCL
jgi:hypothetical protein